MAPWVKDLVVSLQWLRSLLWCRFDPWPGNFHMLLVQPKKKKEKTQVASCKAWEQEDPATSP